MEAGDMITVLVLSGGPDAEHDVSINSGRTIAQALRDAGRFDVNLVAFDELTEESLRAMRGDVVFPTLHGPFGEGGALQRMLDADGRPYVASGAMASRAAIDKILTKAIATRLALRTAPTAILDPNDTGLGMPLPIVVKPVFEGSTIGLYVCHSREQWLAAHRASVATGKPTMIEPLIPGRELTVGLVDRGHGLEALPVIEIVAAEGLYDYEAKYTRDDTRYLIGPELPPGVADRIQQQTLVLAQEMGIRDLCRADFILDDQSNAYFLEINTMPGFTSHSLVPMAAAAAGIDPPSLCATLIDIALERSGRHGRKEEAKQARGGRV